MTEEEWDDIELMIDSRVAPLRAEVEKLRSEFAALERRLEDQESF